MSHTVEYRPFIDNEALLSDKNLDWILEEWCGQFRNVHGKIEIVDSLPDEIIKGKLLIHIGKIVRHAQIVVSLKRIANAK